MIGIPSAEPPVVVLRDLDVARERLREAVHTADDATRPGLELAVALLTGLHVDQDELVVEWARRVLDEAHVDVGTNEVEAIAALRSAVPGMNLRAATALAGRVKSAG